MKKPPKHEAAMRCLDEIEVSRWNLEALAGLLELCSEMGRDVVISARLVGGAGALLGEEIERMKAALERLRQEIGR